MWKGEWRAYVAWRFGSPSRRLIIAAVAVCVVDVTGGCERPPLRVRRTGDNFILDVQTLGEYQTSVARMRLSRGREVIWEVKARDRAPQLHTLLLRVGTNPSVPLECGGGLSASCERSWPSDGFIVVIPAQGGSFKVEQGAEYVLELWGTESRSSRVAATISP